MRRFSPIRKVAGLVTLLFFAVPVGMTVVGCSKTTPVQYCTGNNESGPVLGQATKITLASNLISSGESLNYGQIGQSLSASATDCQANSVSIRSFTFNSTDDSKTYADINPSTGQVCAGTWNRQTGGGIPDYTICNAPASTPKNSVAYVTASADGVTSNAIAVYVHPVVSGIVLGGASPAGSCPTTANPNGNDPGSDCCPFITTGTPVAAPVYAGTSCLSQGAVGQLVARVYANGQVNAANNITCSVGHLNFNPQTTPAVVTIDQNGVATANQPGSTIVTATVANSATGGGSAAGASAGFFATCPPASIVLSLPNSTATTVSVPLNNLQPLTATVLDTNGKPITGLNLEFNSTTPQIIPGTVGAVTPVFPGTATITAVCQPGACNPSPFSQIGLYGNGEPITSNGITVNATGTSSTVLYMGSTQSQYVQPRDFTTSQVSGPIKLPYAPNSMVITQDGTAIYLGSDQGLMTITTGNNAASAAPNQAIPGTVLTVSPDGSTIVVTDPKRNTVSLVSNSGSVTSSYGGTGVRAQFTPDSLTLYVTTTANTLLLHSAFLGWQSIGTGEAYADVSVTVPNVGAYFAGPASLDGRSYCSASTFGAGAPPAVTNQFAPLADQKPAPTQRIAATNDGGHVIGANAAGGAATLTDLHVSFPASATQPGTPGSCTTTTAPVFFNSNATNTPLAGVAATGITGVFPTSNSTLAFVTYQGTSGILPLYVPNGTGAGTFTPLTLGNGATAASAPVSGVFSTDNLFFYAGTSGDNQVHQFSINGTTATESGVLSPALPASAGTGTVQVNLIVQRPKRTQN